MTTIREELRKESSIINCDCDCCSEEVVEFEMIMRILKENNIEVDKELVK